VDPGLFDAWVRLERGFWGVGEWWEVPGLPIVMAPRTMGNAVLEGEDMVAVLEIEWMGFIGLF
jgi:hypothetical protein